MSVLGIVAIGDESPERGAGLGERPVHLQGYLLADQHLEEALDRGVIVAAELFAGRWDERAKGRWERRVQGDDSSGVDGGGVDGAASGHSIKSVSVTGRAPSCCTRKVLIS